MKTLDEAIKEAEEENAKKAPQREENIKKERREEYKKITELIRSGKACDLDLALEMLERSKQAIFDSIKMNKSLEGHPSECLDIGKASIIKNKNEIEERGIISIGKSSISLKSDA